MQEVAEAAGVHRTTVSLALRDSPRLPTATRAHVRAVAERLGYRPNPLVAVLMAERGSRRQRVAQGNLAFLSNDAQRPPDWQHSPKAYARLFRGAAKQAGENGYGLTPFWLGESGLSAPTFTRLLHDRGIRGVLIAPHFDADRHIELDWDRFSVLEFGYNSTLSPFNRVAHDYFSSMQRICQEAIARGHRRIGFMSPQMTMNKTRHLWRAAFVDFQQGLAPAARIPPLINAPQLTQAVVDPWLERHRPDAVIVGGIQYPKPGREPQPYQLPRRLSVFNLDCARRDGSAVGIFQDWPALGALGVDLLIGQLGRNRFGIPAQAHTVLMSGHWQGEPHRLACTS